MGWSRLDDTLRNTLATAFAGSLDGGTVEIYDDDGDGIPTGPDVAVTNQTLLAICNLGDPAFTVTGPTAAANPIEEEDACVGAGLAAWARLKNSSGIARLDVDAGATGSGASLIVDYGSESQIEIGGILVISSLSFTVPATTE